MILFWEVEGPEYLSKHTTPCVLECVCLQYCANVALKINAKLDGVNAKLLDDPSRPARFVPVVSVSALHACGVPLVLCCSWALALLVFGAVVCVSGQQGMPSD